MRRPATRPRPARSAPTPTPRTSRTPNFQSPQNFQNPQQPQNVQPADAYYAPSPQVTPNGHAAPGPDAYAQQSYDRPGYDQQGYDPQGHGQQDHGSYPPQDGYAQNAYRQDSHPGGVYGQDPYHRDGPEQPSNSPYGTDDLPPAGPSRSAQRGPQRLGGMKMVAYLLASVIGVVVIVLLVVRLTKTGSNTPAAGSTTSTTPSAAAGPASKYVFKAASTAGSYKLNSAATKTFGDEVKTAAASVAAEIRTSGAGSPGKDVVAVYSLTSVTNPAASNFRAVEFHRLRRHVQRGQDHQGRESPAHLHPYGEPGFARRGDDVRLQPQRGRRRRQRVPVGHAHHVRPGRVQSSARRW